MGVTPGSIILATVITNVNIISLIQSETIIFDLGLGNAESRLPKTADCTGCSESSVHDGWQPLRLWIEAFGLLLCISKDKCTWNIHQMN